MGEVWVAEQTGVGDFRKPLALKVMLPGLDDDPKHVSLFLAEARIAARLHHPNIVQVFDAGLIDGRYFLTMELIDGAPLTAIVKSARTHQRPIDVEVLCLVARQTLEALRHAHEALDEQGAPLELVHRDISPSNILVSTRGEVKLTDFGIAKMRTSESNTAPGEVRGKLAYIAPELFQGATASVRSDLYALGVTLYRLATLSSPFSKAEESDLSNTLRRQVVPLSTRRPDLPVDIAAAIERALAPNPKNRFPSAAAMLEAFPRGDLEVRQQRLAALVREALDVAPVNVSLGTAPMQPAVAPSLTVLEPIPDAQRDVATVAAVQAPARRRSTGVALAGGAVMVVLLLGLAWWRRPPPVVAVDDAPTPAPIAVEPKPVAPPVVAAPVPVPAQEREPVPEAPKPIEPVRRPTTPPRKAPQAAVVPTLDPPALLFVQAQPWAVVELDGRKVGETPLGRLPITRPSVVLRLSNPGFKTLERRLTLSAGQELRVKETLEPK